VEKMAEITTTSNSYNEEIEKLYDDKKKDEAEALIRKFITEEPDNLDAHAWAARVKSCDAESEAHYAFIFDRNIHYVAPYKDNPHDIHIDFLMSLKMQELHTRNADQENEEREKRIISEKIVHYSELFLKAGRSIASVPDFAQALLMLERYDDVINLSKYFAQEVEAHALGWPGLIVSKSIYSDDKEELLTFALDAYFLSHRFAEGCRLVKNRIVEEMEKKYKYEYYSWFLLAQTLAWLGYPEETARALIIAVRKGYSAVDISFDSTFDNLCNLTVDPDFSEKSELAYSLHMAKKLVPADKAEIYDDLRLEVNRAVHDAGKEIPSVSYIESKLGIQLPKQKKRKRLHAIDRMIVASKKSTDPVVKEIIEFIDKNIGTEVLKNEKISKKTGTIREKVSVGAPLTVRRGETLDQFGVDLTLQAAEGTMAPVIGRDREIERMMRILSRAEKNTPFLLGEAGVGKTAVVQGLAQRIVKGDVPETLKGRKIIELNVGVLVAGTTYRGEFEQRMNDIIKETSENPDILLFIDELHTLMGAGATTRHGLDGSNMLKPALAAGKLRLIGATTPGEYSRSIEKDPAMERRFSPVWLTEIDKNMTRAVLDARKGLWEKHHGVTIDDDVFDAAIQLTDQHVRHRHFPDKAIDAIDEACALARTLAGGDELTNRVKQDHVNQVIDTWSGSRKDQPSAIGGSFLSDIRQQFGKRVIGHEEIIERLATIVADEKLGLRLSSLPRVLCFAGRSQSGKTETATAMAQVFWPDEKDRFLFVNMPLLSSEHDLNRLIGVSQGYAGSDSTGVLPLHLRQHPHSLVFLYQFPKAHPRVMRFFGTLFEQGCFPDPDGRTVYAGSTIFVLSATCDDINATFGFGPGNAGRNDSKNQDIHEILKKLGTPETVLNSLNDTFWFHSLSKSQVRTIIEQRLQKAMSQPGIRELDICIGQELSDSLMQEYFATPPASRNLQTLLNRKGYRAIAEGLKYAV
jgi:ATP-dependent Clp protease ATP-binding subunit ClpC